MPTGNKPEVMMKKSQIGFLFILPWLLGLIIFTVFPIIAALYIS
ncbi:MAG TPA: sugar ABC transporter permease, partial [Firmicutes bacterium]|nr:sugar ABC transporter permease [Bacillota bacterium]